MRRVSQALCALRLRACASQVGPRGSWRHTNALYLAHTSQVAQPSFCDQALRWHAHRGFACRTKFDAPAPKLVLVEYDPADVDSFIAVADSVEAEFGDVQVEGNVEGVTPRGRRRGAFEVTVEGGAVLFSKLKMARMPTDREVVDAIRTHVPGAGTFVAGQGGCA